MERMLQHLRNIIVNLPLTVLTVYAGRFDIYFSGDISSWPACRLPSQYEMNTTQTWLTIDCCLFAAVIFACSCAFSIKQHWLDLVNACHDVM